MKTEISSRTFLKETIALKVNTEAAFLELATRLYKIHTEEVWKGEYDSYEEFLLDARISKATASKLESVYAVFILKHNISQKKLATVGWSSLYAIASRSGTREKAEELIQKASLLSRSDLEVVLRNDKGQQDTCAHSDSRLVKVCNDCGFRVAVHEV